MSICILMSTYNGQKYIGSQLKSILSQSVSEPISFVIRDDGSTDYTVDIIKRVLTKYKANYKLYKGKNIGPAKSFLRLLSVAPNSDYYAFCDQDDVWVQGKLKVAKDAIDRVEKVDGTGCPVLWISDYNVTDARMNIIEDHALHNPEMDQLKALFYNNVPGCAMMFNRSLMNNLRQIGMSDFRMHDILTLCVALISGKVIYDNRPYILYRQHSDNAVGRYHKTYNLIEWIADKQGVVFSKKTFGYAKYARRVLNVFGDELDERLKKEYELIASYKKGVNRFKLLSRPYTKDKFGRTSVSVRLRILLGKV